VNWKNTALILVMPLLCGGGLTISWLGCHRTKVRTVEKPVPIPVLCALEKPPEKPAIAPRTKDSTDESCVVCYNRVHAQRFEQRLWWERQLERWARDAYARCSEDAAGASIE
jgi:hypothetical protein